MSSIESQKTVFFGFIIIIIFIGVGLLYVKNFHHSAVKPTPEEVARAELLKPGLFKMDGYGYSLPYRLFVPKEYDSTISYPLLLVLHGVGAEGNDNVRQVGGDVAFFCTDLQAQIEPAFILAPQLPTGTKWVPIPKNPPYLNYSQQKIPESDGLKLAKLLLQNILKEYSVDVNRLYVTGFSAGAAGVWDIISRDDIRIFAAAIAVSGAFDPYSAEHIAKMPLWMFHGADDPLSPPSNMLDAVEQLKKHGSHVQYKVFEGAGHGGTLSLAYKEPGLFEWLFRQKLSNWYKLP